MVSFSYTTGSLNKTPGNSSFEAKYLISGFLIGIWFLPDWLPPAFRRLLQVHKRNSKIKFEVYLLAIFYHILNTFNPRILPISWGQKLHRTMDHCHSRKFRWHNHGAFYMHMSIDKARNMYWSWTSVDSVILVILSPASIVHRRFFYFLCQWYDLIPTLVYPKSVFPVLYFKMYFIAKIRQPCLENSSLMSYSPTNSLVWPFTASALNEWLWNNKSFSFTIVGFFNNEVSGQMINSVYPFKSLCPHITNIHRGSISWVLA